MVRWFGVDPRHEDYTRGGAVVGVADLVDVHWAHAGCCDSPWAEPGTDVVHLVLEQPRALERPVPCRGALGLWFLPDDVHAEVDAQL